MEPVSRNHKAPFSSATLIEVVVCRPFARGFTYRVAAEMALQPGDYVQVPFGAQELVGVVWGEAIEAPPPGKCKEVLRHLSHLASMSAAMRAFLSAVADYTLSPLGQVLKMALPIPNALLNPPCVEILRLAAVEAGRLSEPRERVIRFLQTHVRASLEELEEQTGVSRAVIRGMQKAGMLASAHQPLAPARQAFAPLSHAPTLRAEQQRAASRISQALGAGFDPILLQGVTGSGKTEVYFDVIERMLREQAGAQVLVLLPEIALSVQWMQRFEQRFGAAATLWHSSVSEAARRRNWQAVQQGSARVVVGARSALFLPFADLRLIIVDEEHEASFKQEEGVLYHGRDMAVLRASKEQIPIVLSSASPSMETQANVQAGKYTQLMLSERHGAFHEPRPELIDLRSDKPERGSFLSPKLREAITQTLVAGHQAMLFLNRRGYAPLLLCRSCGHRFQCLQCDAWMVHHQRPQRLQCHQCDARQAMPEQCPSCGSEELVACGPGVERIAEEAAELWPQARRAILSSDEQALAEQIARVGAGEVDLIIGTQMVAKGHHFPRLALVGVVDGDIGLQGGDIRASERCYQLLHQLAGRAGREAVEGRVLLQTTQPDHPLMQALVAGDQAAFMRDDMAMREQAGWPPFGRLAHLLLEGVRENQVQEAAHQLIRRAPRFDGVHYLGPAPAPIARQRGKYRYRILVKTSRQTHIQKLVKAWVEPVELPSGVRLKIDIDPYQFL